jgi:hypothetical protein
VPNHAYLPVVGLAAPQARNAPLEPLLGSSKSIELNFDPNDGYFKRQVSDRESFRQFARNFMPDHTYFPIVGLAAPQAGNAPSEPLLGASGSLEVNFDPNDGYFKRQVSDRESFRQFARNFVPDHTYFPIVGLAAPQAGNAPSEPLLGASGSLEVNFDPNDGYFKRQESDRESFRQFARNFMLNHTYLLDLAVPHENKPLLPNYDGTFFKREASD